MKAGSLDWSFAAVVPTGQHGIAELKSRLRDLRTERGWSQRQLGLHLGVSRQTINALEREKYDPSLPLAFKIARLFERPIESIFDPDDHDGGEAGR